MTVPAQSRFSYSFGNGVAVSFPYNFMIPGTVDDPQFLVYLVESATGTKTPLQVDADFTISGLGNDSGGFVTYPLSGAPLASTHMIVIQSAMPYEQQTDVFNSGTLYLQSIEDQFDNTIRLIQQMNDRLSRTFTFGIGAEGQYELFPAPDKLIGWNFDGTALENKDLESTYLNEVVAASEAAVAAAATASAAATAVEGFFDIFEAGIGVKLDTTTVATTLSYAFDVPVPLGPSTTLQARLGGVLLYDDEYSITEGGTNNLITLIADPGDGQRLYVTGAAALGEVTAAGTVAASGVDNDSVVVGANVKEALETLQAAIGSGGSGDVETTSFAVWPSGTLRTMKQRATDVYCILDAPGAPDPTGANDSSTALAAMAASGITGELTKGSFICSQQLVLQPGVQWRGAGGPKLVFGTPSGWVYDSNSKIIFDGTGAKVNTIPGASALSVSNPSVGEAYLADSGTRGNTYKTNDFTVPFSAAVILGIGSGLKDLGIFPDFNGVDGYLGATGALSDNWDVGVWARNAERWQIDNCVVYGHWRKSALLVSAHDMGEPVASCQGGRATNSYFQGFYGVSIRSPETAGGNNWGFGGTSFLDCDIRPLSHGSRHLATSSYLSAPFASPSGCMEVSGYIMRGIKWYNCTFLGWDDICMFLGQQEEMQFVSCYQEAKDIKVSGSTLANSTGSRMVGISTTVRPRFMMNTKAGPDFSPWQTRESGCTRYTATGVYNPSGGYDDDQLQQYFNTYQGPRLRSSGQGWRVLSHADETLLTVEPNGRITPGYGGYQLPSYTTTQLADASHAVNTTGKFLYKMVMNSTTGIAMRANGSATTSTWKDFLGGNTISPS